MSGMSFICRSIDENEIPNEIIESKSFVFPQVHTNSKDIVNLSKQIKYYNKDSICTVPFCSTVEVEALGGKVNLGDDKIGPRINSFLYDDIECLRDMKNINLKDKRIKEVLDAIEILSKEGEVVSLNIAGPFMIATSLIDPMIFYKSLRKNKELVKEILIKIEDNLIEYIKEALKRGVKVISFGDSVGTVDIVGPKVYKDIAGDTVLNTLKKIEGLKEFENSIVHICGKTSVSLEKYGFIKSNPVIIGEMKYGESIIDIMNNRKDVRFIGHSCIKKTPSLIKSSKVWNINLM